MLFLKIIAAMFLAVSVCVYSWCVWSQKKYKLAYLLLSVSHIAAIALMFS